MAINIALSGWWLGDDGQGLEMLKEAVAMIAQRRVPTADLVKHLGLRATPGDTPGEPAEGRN